MRVYEQCLDGVFRSIRSKGHALERTSTKFYFSDTSYLTELGESAQADIFEQSSVDGSLRDAFRKMRHFLMTTQELSKDDSISLMSVVVDFGVTQIIV